MRYCNKCKEGFNMNEDVRYKKSISIRCDEKMEHMIDELEKKLLLNTTSIMRLALATLYKSQIEDGESNEYHKLN